MQSRLASESSDIHRMDQKAWFYLFFYMQKSYRFWTTLVWTSEFLIELSPTIATGQTLKRVHIETFKIALVAKRACFYRPWVFIGSTGDTRSAMSPKSCLSPSSFCAGRKYFFLSGCWDHKTTGAHVVLYSEKAFFNNRACHFDSYVIYSPSCPLCYSIRGLLPREVCHTRVQNSSFKCWAIGGHLTCM